LSRVEVALLGVGVQPKGTPHRLQEGVKPELDFRVHKKRGKVLPSLYAARIPNRPKAHRALSGPRDRFENGPVRFIRTPGPQLPPGKHTVISCQQGGVSRPLAHESLDHAKQPRKAFTKKVPHLVVGLVEGLQEGAGVVVAARLAAIDPAG
jgi:hypothetical protein